MAGDWIKMRGGLLTNPKVIRMARFLSENEYFMEWFCRGTRMSCKDTVFELCDVTVVTRVTVGSLLGVWSSVNEVANEDGFIPNIQIFEVDEMAGVPGFGDAMELVGWCQETDEGVIFPNFAEHNIVGKSRLNGAKTGAQRTKEWRERKKPSQNVTRDSHGDVTVTRHGDDREEKRREEKIVNTEDPPTPQGGNGEGQKQKRKRTSPSDLPPGFEKFWEEYPRKEAKASAITAFRKISPSEDDLKVMIDALCRKKVSVDWNKDDGQFIPHPATWLNQRRWEDQGTKAPRPEIAAKVGPKEFKTAAEKETETFNSTFSNIINNATPEEWEAVRKRKEEKAIQEHNRELLRKGIIPPQLSTEPLKPLALSSHNGAQ